MDMSYLKKLDIKLVKSKYSNPIKGQVYRPEQVYKVFHDIKDKAQETLIAVYLNNDLISLAYNVVSVGNRCTTVAEPRDIYGYGYVLLANYYILIHNHPQGNPNPSKEDHTTIRELISSAKMMKMNLLDFIIIGELSEKNKKKNYWSLFEQLDGGEYSLGSVS